MKWNCEVHKCCRSFLWNTICRIFSNAFMLVCPWNFYTVKFNCKTFLAAVCWMVLEIFHQTWYFATTFLQKKGEGWGSDIHPFNTIWRCFCVDFPSVTNKFSKLWNSITWIHLMSSFPFLHLKPTQCQSSIEKTFVGSFEIWTWFKLL